MIEIQGFTAKQRMLADIIWACKTRNQVDTFVQSLPDADRKQAEIVTEMIILAFIDEAATDTQDAKRVIKELIDKI